MSHFPWLETTEGVRMEETGKHCYDLLAVRMADEKRSFELLVKNPLGGVEKAGDYLRFLDKICKRAPCLLACFIHLQQLTRMVPVCSLAAAKKFARGV